MSVSIEDAVEDREEEGGWVSSISQPLVEDLLELAVLRFITAVANISHEFRLDERAFGCIRMERVIGNIEIEVHLLLMNSDIEDEQL